MEKWMDIDKEVTSWFQTLALFWMLYAFFWVIPPRLNYICGRFGTLCLFHLHRQVGMKNDWGWECLCIYMGKVLAGKNILTCTIPWLTPIRALSPSHTRPWPPCVLLPFTACFCNLPRHYPVTLLPISSGYFLAKLFPYKFPLHSQTQPFFKRTYEDGTVIAFRNVGI